MNTTPQDLKQQLFVLLHQVVLDSHIQPINLEVWILTIQNCYYQMLSHAHVYYTGHLFKKSTFGFLIVLQIFNLFWDFYPLQIFNLFGISNLLVYRQFCLCFVFSYKYYLDPCPQILLLGLRITL